MAWLHYKLYRPYAICLVFLILINLLLWIYPVIDAGTVFRFCPGYWLFVFLVTVPFFLAFPVVIYLIFAIKYFKIPAVEQAALPSDVQASRTTLEYLKIVGYVTLATFVLLATCMCLILTAIAAAYHQQHVSLVQETISILRDIVVKGDKIVIERDSEGFSHITGSDIEDVAFGLGFAHARDRLFQMDYYRRIARGQLSEIVGDRALYCDKYMRTLSLYNYGVSHYTNLTSDTQTFVSRYAAGVNYYKGRYGSSNKAFETTLGSYDIADWTIYDSMAVLKLWQFINSGNANMEILRFYLATVKELSMDRVMDLVPMTPLNSSFASFTPVELDTPVSLRNIYRQTELDSLTQDRLNNINAQSNIGVTSPKSTSTSYTAPKFASVDDLLLYFDPLTTMLKQNSDWIGAGGYLFGTALSASSSAYVSSKGEGFRTQVPNPVYVAKLKFKTTASTYSSMGPTIPGIPGLIEGRSSINTFTTSNMYADCMDWYIIKDDGSSNNYAANGATLPYTTRTETINVKGASAVTITVRSTVYGPIMTDILPDTLKKSGAQLALKWTSLSDVDLTMNWITQAWQQTTLATFNTLTVNNFHNPPMNMLVMFTAAYPVYFGVGRFPIRATGHSGLFPASNNQVWTGYNAALVNFRAFIARKDYFVSANNKPVGYGYRYNFGYDFGHSYRARRLNDLISPYYGSTTTPFLEADLKKFIKDQVNVYFSEDLMPLLTKSVNYYSDISSSSIGKLLLAWDGSFTSSSSEAPIAQRWYYELSRIAASDTGVAYWDNPIFVRDAFLPNYVYSKNGTTVTSETISSDTQNRNIQSCVLALSTIYGVTGQAADQTACDLYAAKALQSVIKKYGDPKLGNIYEKKFSHYFSEDGSYSCACTRSTYSVAGGEFTIYQSAPVRPDISTSTSSTTGLDENYSPRFYSNQGFYFQQYAVLGANSVASSSSIKPKILVPGGITGHQWDKTVYDTYLYRVLEGGEYPTALLEKYSVSSSQTLVQVTSV
ncbi:penicillin amidase family protein [Naegleria gruberi]|uniref:Penicillin amidase family protein n=1 Tax=Naegleria gruberi TaxID=5762 RepID=D2V5X3_NAEGR|nr:penicillin amidase family protein [Naegleria gruberi]EFC47872.1 penicillin amidase family protein [Naegleria gruberi]|eukprot:XP_002680616.1 penicillin amidase family protein [Naegleria gruberi strain NEG-M]